MFFQAVIVYIHIEKEGLKMLDLALLVTLLVCFGLMKLLTDWCSRQVDKDNSTEKK